MGRKMIAKKHIKVGVCTIVFYLLLVGHVFCGVGPELIVNGSFSAGTAWIDSGGSTWAIDGGVATHSGADSQLYQSPLVVGHRYWAVFTSTFSSGICGIAGTTVEGGYYPSQGLNVLDFTAYSEFVSFYATGDCVLDNISFREVLPDPTTYYVKDGGDNSNPTDADCINSGTCYDDSYLFDSGDSPQWGVIGGGDTIYIIGEFAPTESWYIHSDGTSESVPLTIRFDYTGNNGTVTWNKSGGIGLDTNSKNYLSFIGNGTSNNLIGCTGSTCVSQLFVCDGNVVSATLMRMLYADSGDATKDEVVQVEGIANVTLTNCYIENSNTNAGDCDGVSIHGTNAVVSIYGGSIVGPIGSTAGTGIQNSATSTHTVFLSEITFEKWANQIDLGNENSNIQTIDLCTFNLNDGIGVANVGVLLNEECSNSIVTNNNFNFKDTVDSYNSAIYINSNSLGVPTISGNSIQLDYNYSATNPDHIGIYVAGAASPKIHTNNILTGLLYTIYWASTGDAGKIYENTFTNDSISGSGITIVAAPGPHIYKNLFNVQAPASDSNFGIKVEGVVHTGTINENIFIFGNALFCTAVRLEGAAARTNIINNTIYNYDGTATTYGIGVWIQDSGGSAIVSNNIFYGLLYGIYAPSGSTIKPEDNIYYDVGTFAGGDATYTAADSGQENINADPLFFDANAGNFQIKANSPAIDAGTAIDGIHSAGNADVDIGAYEAKCIRQGLPGKIWSDYPPITGTITGGDFSGNTFIYDCKP